MFLTTRGQKKTKPDMLTNSYLHNKETQCNVSIPSECLCPPDENQYSLSFYALGWSPPALEGNSWLFSCYCR